MIKEIYIRKNNKNWMKIEHYKGCYSKQDLNYLINNLKNKGFEIII